MKSVAVSRLRKTSYQVLVSLLIAQIVAVPYQSATPALAATTASTVMLRHDSLPVPEVSGKQIHDILYSIALVDTVSGQASPIKEDTAGGAAVMPEAGTATGAASEVKDSPGWEQTDKPAEVPVSTGLT